MFRSDETPADGSVPKGQSYLRMVEEELLSGTRSAVFFCSPSSEKVTTDASMKTGSLTRPVGLLCSCNHLLRVDQSKESILRQKRYL